MDGEVNANLKGEKMIKHTIRQFAENFTPKCFTAFISYTIAIVAYAICLWLPATTEAAGLGRIKVESALGQPFSAEIEITALQADEFPQAQARVANAETYEAAKVVYPSIARQIRVSAERLNDGKPILKLTSNAPINEPLLDLLVEFSWGNGRVMQKYSVLLDLPNVSR